MKKTAKVWLTVLCAVILTVGAVFGTLAYFTDNEAATNTFTVGKVGITLDESDVDDSTTEKDRDYANEYHLLPGHTYVKDPTVTVLEGSSEAYVRMMVEVENIDKLKAVFTSAEYYYNGDANGMFLLQKLCMDAEGNSTWNADDWKMHGYKKSGTSGIYEFRYKEKVAGAKTLSALFEAITVPGDDVTSANIDNLRNVKINVTAHAIQAAGFDDVDAAWEAFGTQHPGV